MTPLQIVGNVLSGIGLFLFFISSLLKNKKKILWLQTGNHTFGLAAELCTAQYSGAVQDIVSIIRNLSIIYHKNNKALSVLFIVVGLILGIVSNIMWNDNNPWGYLPVFAALEYSIVILIPNIKTPWIKLAMCVSTVCWAIYGFVFKNYAMMAANIITFFTSLISIFIYFHTKNKLEINEVDADEIKS